MNESQSTRGHTKKIYKERSRLEIRKHSFRNRITDVWNSLPQKVVDCKTVISFERNIDKFWKQQDKKFHYRQDISTSSAHNYLYKTVEEDEELPIPKVDL